MYYRRFKKLQQYINDVPKEVYQKGDFLEIIKTDNLSECQND